MPSDHDPLPNPQELAKLPPDGGERFNRLVFETSPYLLQHARNPVDWYPWGDEAFERARREGKPVLVSIGYSTCHWCHVMERQSFEDPEVAEVINKHVVPVKVDREQRPDLDTLYMTAAQVMTGSGGWPLNVMLTPDGEPFFAATYIPPRPAYGRPGVTTLVPQLAALYRAEDPRIGQTIEQLKPIMQQQLSGLAELAPEAPSTDHVQAALDGFVQSVDPVRGGTEGAPKFPPHGALALALAAHRDLDAPEAFEAVRVTLDGMARGGIHDHVGGGFHRYSTDADWLVPHFEKMLYDNAQLLHVYAEAFAQTGSALYHRAARGIVRWLGREMTDPGGGFYSALDADSEGEEGLFYTWTWDELNELLDEADLTFAARVYGLSPRGNYHDEATGQPTGRNIPALQGPLEALAENADTSTTDLLARLDEINNTLLEARSTRVRPGLDDKILAAWNGLAIAGLAHAGSVMTEPTWVERAERAAGFVIDTLLEGDLLQRSIRAGKPSGPGYLDDYACTAHGLLVLHRVTGTARYLEVARRLGAVVLDRFDDGSGLFTMTDDRHDRLILRPHDVLDQATPSGNGTMASVLVRLASLDEDPKWTEAARKLLRASCPLVRRVPAASFSIASAAWDRVHDDAAETGGKDVLAEIDDGVLRLTLSGAPPEVSPGDTLDLELKLDIAEGLHVNAYRPGVEGLVGAHVQAAKPWELTEVDYPEGDLLGGPGRGHPRVYTGTVVLPVTLRAPGHVGPGSATIKLSLSAQPCTEASCLDVRTVTLAVPTRLRE